jgi:hypothetical protein
MAQGPKPTREDQRRDQHGENVRADAQRHWDSGYTHYFLTVDGTANTAYLIQWVETVGWRLEHAGWVWAEKGYVGYGGFGVLNSGVIGNFLFGRPEGVKPASSSPAVLGDGPTRSDA